MINTNVKNRETKETKHRDERVREDLPYEE